MFFLNEKNFGPMDRLLLLAHFWLALPWRMAYLFKNRSAADLEVREHRKLEKDALDARQS